MFASNYAARISLTAAGAQDAEITSYTRMPGDGRPTIVVRSGDTLTYCRHQAEVALRAEAWANAIGKAAAIFPAHYAANERFSGGVAAQIIAQPGDTWDVTGYHARATHDSRAALYVRTGALTVRCLDLTAVLGLHDAWHEAELTAAVLWLTRSDQ